MAALYTGGIDHTEKTLELLFRTQYYTYQGLRMLARMAVGFVMVAAALLLSLPMWAKGLLLLIGCWLVVSKDFPSAIRADRAMEARHGVLPRMRYTFRADGVELTGEGSMKLKYSQFTRLIEDEGYLYLFIDRNSVCMVDRATLALAPAEDFMRFIGEKTGLPWKRCGSLFSMNLHDLLQMLRDARQNRRKDAR